LAWLASWPARWLVAVAETGAGVPAGAVPWPAGLLGGVALAALTIGVLVATRWPSLRRVLLVVAVAVVAGSGPVRWLASGWPPADTVVIACDVGQGDAIVLPVRPGEAVVVDAGPDPVAVDGCLRRLGVRSVALLVVTHFHADHIGGVTGVVRDRAVGAVLVPTFDEPADGQRSLRDAVGPAPVVEAGAGWRFALASLEITVLAPTETMTGTRSDPNNNSLILRAVNRGVAVLLAGDAETEQQEAMLRTVGRDELRASVLKLAHHGSAYQDPHLLAAVDPVVALVSVGADNPYGHPSPALLSRLERDGTRVVRTDLSGDVAVVVTADGLGVSARGPTR
jgi:competence protein ComEC